MLKNKLFKSLKAVFSKVGAFVSITHTTPFTKTITPTTIHDEENTVQRRYMMFSLTYKIEKFAGKEKLSSGRWYSVLKD